MIGFTLEFHTPVLPSLNGSPVETYFPGYFRLYLMSLLYSNDDSGC